MKNPFPFLLASLILAPSAYAAGRTVIPEVRSLGSVGTPPLHAVPVVSATAVPALESAGALQPLSPIPAPREDVRPEPAALRPVQLSLFETAAFTAAQPQGAGGDGAVSAELTAKFDGAKAAKGVSLDWIKEMRAKDARLTGGERRLRDVVQRLGFEKTALNREILARHNENPNYTIELSRGPITNQKQSGRCWIFAALNMVRSMMHPGDQPGDKAPKDLEFSENYLHFVNMLEKTNSHLEEVTEKLYRRHRKQEKFDENKRRMTVIPSIGDGGWWEYFAFLTSKYGLVPKAAMGETISSEATAALLGELDSALAASSAELMENARLFKAGKQKNRSAEIQKRAMARVWTILATHLGEFPETFEYREREKPVKVEGITTTKVKVAKMTPLEYMKNVAKFDPADYISVTSYPGKQNNAVYEIKKSAIGRAAPGQRRYDLRFLNVDSARMEQLAAAAIKGGQAVWFAADIKQDVDRASGIAHPRIFDRDEVYQFGPGEQVKKLTRKELSYFHEIVANHAMLLTGLDQPDPNGPIIKFKDENSWGEETGSKGIYHIYHEWFMQNVFEVVVHKRFLSEDETKLWQGKAKQTKRKS